MSGAIAGAPNFTLAELTRSATARRLGLDNTPDAESCARLVHVAQEIAQPARDFLGPIRVTSGYRSPRVNAAVGGSPTSAHTKGAALDLQPLAPRTGVAELALWIVEHSPVWDQVIFERNAHGREWVHVSLWPPGERPNRRELRRRLPGDAGYPHTTRAWLFAQAL
jgi:hypothetical protein